MPAYAAKEVSRILEASSSLLSRRRRTRKEALDLSSASLEEVAYLDASSSTPLNNTTIHATLVHQINADLQERRESIVHAEG